MDSDGADVRVGAVEHPVHDLLGDGAGQRSRSHLASANTVGQVRWRRAAITLRVPVRTRRPRHEELPGLGLDVRGEAREGVTVLLEGDDATCGVANERDQVAARVGEGIGGSRAQRVLRLPDDGDQSPAARDHCEGATVAVAVAPFELGQVLLRRSGVPGRWRLTLHLGGGDGDEQACRE